MTRDSIILGADSRARNSVSGVLNGQKFSQSTFYNVCKITVVNNILISGAGIRIPTLADIASECIRKTKDIRTAVSLFEQESKKRLTDTLERIRATDKGGYVEDFIKRKIFAEMFFCTYENNSPMFYYVAAQITNDVNHTTNLLIEDTPKYLISPDDIFVKPLGEADALMQHLPNNRNIWNNSAQKEVMELINYQALADTIHVGLPISVVTIYKNKPLKWYSHGCCDIKSTNKSPARK